MSNTYEDMSITVQLGINATSMKTAIDIETFIEQMRITGVTEDVIVSTLLGDLNVGGRIFGSYKNGIKNVTKDGLLKAGNVAKIKTYQEAGIQELNWTVVSDNPCADCLEREGEIGSLEYFETIGMPKSGFSVCSEHCQCQLDPVETKGTGGIMLKGKK